MRTTPAQRQQYTLEALGCLGAARTLRQTRASWVRDAIKAYEWRGPLTSGVEQEHWPDDVKDRLRTNAREIASAIDDAVKLWRKAGKRLFTFRRTAAEYRVDGSRY
jgi:hypothetical protein